MEKYNVLYVDDEPSNIRVFKTVFSHHYNIFTAQSAAKGLNILEEYPISLIITDQRMPNMSGIDFLKQARLKWPDIKSILLTAYTDIEVIKEAINDIGIFSYLNKPFDFSEIKSLMDKALQLYQLNIDENKASIELNLNAKKLHNVLKSISDVFIRVNNDGIIEMISASVYELFGYKPEEIIGKKGVKVFMNEEDRTNDLLHIYEMGFCNNFETDLYTKDNRPLHVIINSRTHNDEDGTPLGIDHLVRDVTEFKLQQNKLEENELKLKNFFNIDSVGIALNDMQGKFIKVNQEFSRITGYSADELNNLSYSDLIPDEYSAQEHMQLDSLTKNNVYVTYEKEYIHKNGHRYPVLINGVKMKGENGEELIWSIIQDISQQKKAEETIENQRELLALVTNAAQLGIWDWDIINDKLIWDDTAYNMYGVKKSKSNAPNKVWESGIHPDDKAYIDLEILVALKGEKSLDTEFRVIWPDNSVHHIHAIANVIRDDHGKAVRMIGTNKDITKTKKTKKMLEALK